MKSPNLSSNAAGAGGATLLVLLAQNLADTNEYKSWLLIIAPSATVILGGIFEWLKENVQDYFLTKSLQRNFKRIQKTLGNALNNENTSEEHKDELRVKLEEAEKAMAENDLERLRKIMEKPRKR